MKKALAISAAVLAGVILVLAAPLAAAHDRGGTRWSVIIGAPPPHVVHGPPPVIYAPPRAVFVQPAPVVQHGRIYYYQPGYQTYYPDNGRRFQHSHRGHHHHYQHHGRHYGSHYGR